MNVAKNWALTIMLIALAFAHFSSELLLKEQMIIPVKKTLNNTGHIDAKLIDFSEISPPKSSEIGCFFLWNRTFLRENLAKSADFSVNFDFSPAKIPQNWPIFPRICPWKFREILLFFREISEALACGNIPQPKQTNIVIEKITVQNTTFKHQAKKTLQP